MAKGITYTTIFLLCFSIGIKADAQKVDSLFFNLYTDSLKRGTHNYINVDGKFSNGRYLPLTSRELVFTSSGGIFEGNSLFIDSSLKDSFVIVKVALKSNPVVSEEIRIYIKRGADTERLRTVDEILNTPPRKKKKGTSFEL